MAQLFDLSDVSVDAQLYAAAVLVILAGWLLILDFGNRSHRVFAVILGLQAGTLVFDAAARGHDYNDFAPRMLVHFSNQLPFAALYGAYVYRRRYARDTGPAWLANRWLVPALLLAGAVAVEAAYITDHALVKDGNVAGPLNLVTAATGPVFLLTAFLMARDALRTQGAGKRKALLLAAVGFSLAALFDAAYLLTNGIVMSARHGKPFLAEPGPSFYGALALNISQAAFLLGALLAGWLFWQRRGRPDDVRRELRRAVAVLGIAAATGIGAATLLRIDELGNLLPFQIHGVLSALWALALAVLVCRALVKHCLFDIDVRLRRALGHAFVAALLVAAFFAVSFAAGTFFPGIGTVSGWVAAGLLLLAVSPLERLGQRLARLIMPRAKAPAEMGPEDRVRAYRDQVALLLAGGGMNVRDRRQLDLLREGLQLPPEWAGRIEREAWAAATAPGSSRQVSTPT